jgi:hypothetical protein
MNTKKIKTDKKNKGFRLLEEKIKARNPGAVVFNVCDRGDGEYVVDHVKIENHY